MWLGTASKGVASLHPFLPSPLPLLQFEGLAEAVQKSTPQLPPATRLR